MPLLFVYRTLVVRTRPYIYRPTALLLCRLLNRRLRVYEIKPDIIVFIWHSRARTRVLSHFRSSARTDRCISPNCVSRPIIPPGCDLWHVLHPKDGAGSLESIP